MPAIPSIASFTGASVTEGEFKTALANLHLFLTGLLGTDGTQAGAQAAMGAILGAGEITKTASYTVTSADRGKVIACSGTFAVTLPDASAVGSGFAVAVANYGTETITVEPFSAQTIDGVSSKPLLANGMIVACAVSGEWLTVGSAPANEMAFRAWVNFKGTGVVTTRGSGNVSSVTLISTGTYRVNFTTAMPDTAFVVLVSGDPAGGSGNKYYGYPNAVGSATVISYNGAGALVDSSIIEVAIFR